MNQVRIPYQKWELIAWINQHPSDARIAPAPICDAIGINWPTQYRKLDDDSRFNCCHMTMVAADGSRRSMVTIPVAQLNRWLFGISPNKVKPEVAPLLVEFQDYCTQAIYMALGGYTNPEVVAELARRIDHLTEQLAQVLAITKELQHELQSAKEENRELRERMNLQTSESARNLRLGHLKN